MIIKGADILTPDGIIKSGILFSKDGIITRVSPMGSERPQVGHEHDNEIYDGAGLTLVPGFIDIHCHGGGGYDTLDGTYESLERMYLAHAVHGTTAILPTTMAAPHETLVQAARLIGKVMETEAPFCAGIPGLHLEGPWINPGSRGAQPIEGIRMPSIKELDILVQAANGYVKMITVAPEMPGALDLIKYSVSMGIKVSLGHSSATYDQVIAAVEAGATHITHAYNGMSGLHHRYPGMVGAMLTCSRLTADVVLDGFHLHRAAAEILRKCKGKERLALITDATMAAGMPSGKYELGGQEVIYSAGAVRLRDGSLAGSALTLDNAVKYAVSELGCSLEEAIAMVSATPARVIGIDDRKGSIEVGKDADLVLLDSSLQVQATIVNGNLTHVSEDTLMQMQLEPARKLQIGLKGKLEERV